MSVFSRNLQFLRQEKSWDLPTCARILGIWEDTLRKLEKGHSEPDVQTLLTVSEVFETSIDHLLKRDLDLLSARLRSKTIRLILLDVDGTMTDGGMFYTESGDVMKRFHVKDGMAIHRMITRHKMQFGLISAGATEKLVRTRAEKLGIQRVYCGTEPKVKILAQWLEELQLTADKVLYVGDDLNDLPIIKKVGISACPADAALQIREAVDICLKTPGGHGCIRELLEGVLKFDISK
ncbi:MAG: HAD family hydrolase [Bacteroidota bacterium]